jgi:hypothetical protein
MLLACTDARAAEKGLMGIADATQSDFEDIKQNFRAAYRSGYGSWESYCKDTGFSLEPYERGISARRAALARIADESASIDDSGHRGLVKMVVSELDDLNLSILMLIHDDKGYAGYISSEEPGKLVENLSAWQESVRTGLKDVRRTIKMARTAASTTYGQAALVPAHKVR